MRRTLCKSKIHRATLTGADLNYEGSISIDRDLLDAADIVVVNKADLRGARTAVSEIEGRLRSNPRNHTLFQTQANRHRDPGVDQIFRNLFPQNV